MNKFVCFTLEGLLVQRHNQVWIMLGLYPTADQARGAAKEAISRSDVIETRIMSYFRDHDWWKSEADEKTLVRPHTAPVFTANEPTIVA